MAGNTLLATCFEVLFGLRFQLPPVRFGSISKHFRRVGGLRFSKLWFVTPSPSESKHTDTSIIINTTIIILITHYHEKGHSNHEKEKAN